MKKYLYLALVILGFACTGKAQNLSHQQFQRLIVYMNKEDWQNAATLSKHYIDSLPKTVEAESSLAVLRYMYITAQAGLMNDRKITKDQALKSLQDMQGHWVVMPWRNFNSKSGSNQYNLAEGQPNTLFCNATNNNATAIFAFEYITLKAPLSVAQFAALEGKPVRVRGKIKSVNVEGNLLPRFRLLVDEADFHSRE